MSDADGFIHEVSEEVRRDRMFGLWKRYAPFVVVVVVAIVGGTALMSWFDHRAEQAAQRAGGALLDAGRDANPDLRASALLALADLSEGGVAVLAQLQAGAALVEAGDVEAAVAAFDAAATAALDQGETALAALADYRAAVLRMPSVGYLDTIGAFSALTTPGNPMRILALEARAVAHIGAGETEAAGSDIDTILADPAATEATRQRVRELATIINAAQAAPAAGG